MKTPNACDKTSHPKTPSSRAARFTRGAAAALAAGGVLAGPLLADSPSSAEARQETRGQAAPITDRPVKAGPIAEPTPASPDVAQAVRQAAAARAAGAAWLVAHQNPDGGWGAGGWQGSATGVQSDVATTALAAMALLRDDPKLARHAEAFERGVAFVVQTIEKSPAQGPLLDGPVGTQPQHKLGRNVDTHFASLLLGEVTGRVSPRLEQRIGVAYDKVLSKVVAAQRADGSFDQDGWAPVLSSSVAAQGLYKALENGKALPEAVMKKNDDYQNRLVDVETGEFDASSGAGVSLYSAASSLMGNAQAAKRAGDQADAAAEAKQAAQRAVRSDDGRLLAGFGSVGGEEMLSYMMISDTLAEDGGDDWGAWKSRIGDHLRVSQNRDGSWSGHHCITSTPFVTAAAVMTLGATAGDDDERSAATARGHGAPLAARGE